MVGSEYEENSENGRMDEDGDFEEPSSKGKEAAGSVTLEY